MSVQRKVPMRTLPSALRLSHGVSLALGGLLLLLLFVRLRLLVLFLSEAEQGNPHYDERRPQPPGVGQPLSEREPPYESLTKLFY